MCVEMVSRWGKVFGSKSSEEIMRRLIECEGKDKWTSITFRVCSSVQRRRDASYPTHGILSYHYRSSMSLTRGETLTKTFG